MPTFNGISYPSSAFLDYGYLTTVTSGTGESLPMWQAAFVDAIADAGKQMRTTSTTSLAVGTGTKVFVLTNDLPYQAGDVVRTTDTSNSANYMYGTVQTYVSATKTLTISVASGDTGGSGTIASWNIAVAGLKGPTGSTGAAGYVSASTTAGTSTAYTATFTPSISSYTVQQPMIFKLHTDCGASPTLNGNTIGALPLFLNGAAAPAGSLKGGVEYVGLYDGTNLQVVGAGGGGDTLVAAVTSAGSSQALNYASGNVFDLKGTASTACTLSFSNLPATGNFARWRLKWTQPASTGGATLVFPASVKWLGQPAPQTAAPSLTTSINFVHEIDFWTIDGGTTVWAYLVGGINGASPSQTAGLYLAAGTAGKVITSTDAVTWTAQAQQFSGANINGCKYAGGVFLLSSDGSAGAGNGAKTSNGTSFTNTSGTVSGSYALTGVAVAGNYAVFTGVTATGANVITCSSGTFAETRIGSSSSLNGKTVLAASDGTGFLVTDRAVAQSKFDYATSGISFAATDQNHSTTYPATLTCLTYAGGNYMLGFANGDLHYKSSVSSTTSTAVTGAAGTNQINAMVYTGTKYVLACNSGKIYNCTTVGGTYVNKTTGLTGNITGMWYNGGILMVVTDASEIARSTDNGDTWTIISTSGSPAPNPFGGSALTFIKYRLTNWWAGGAGGKLGQSTDGTSFALVTSNFSTNTINDFDAV